ncbi:hypothetical protein V8E54_001868 [Elaphomyces granulatus]
MEHSPANIRIMHYIGEFLDLDLASFDSMVGFLALIQAMRDGLTRIDEYFTIPDFHISVLFLSKLEAHPDWRNWARNMMQDKRLNTSDPAKRLDFNALAKLAIERETLMRQRVTMTRPRARTEPILQKPFKDPEAQCHCCSKNNRSSGAPSRESLINGADTKWHRAKEISAQKRSRSQPAPLRKGGSRKYYPLKECFFCGESDDPRHKCQRRMKAIVEVPRAGFAPKHIQYRTESVVRPPIYHRDVSLTAGNYGGAKVISV